jgi:hypothetical protein
VAEDLGHPDPLAGVVSRPETREGYRRFEPLPNTFWLWLACV